MPTIPLHLSNEITPDFPRQQTVTANANGSDDGFIYSALYFFVAFVQPRRKSEARKYF